MRSLILLLLFLTSISANGAVNGSDNLMNLNYYPHEERFLFDPSVTATITDQTSNSSGDGSAISSQTFLIGLIYGIRPGLRLGFSESILWDSVSDAGPTSTGSENASTSSGFSNPTLTTTWRVLDDDNLHLSWDLTFSMSPSLGAKLAANPTLNTIGNNYNGASTLTFAPTWFWGFGANELGFSSRATLALSGTTNGNSTSNSYSTLPYWAFSLVLTDRVHLSERFFLEGLLTYSYSHVSTLQYQNSTQKLQESPNSMEPKALVGWSPETNYLFTLSATFQSSTTITVTNGITQVGTKDDSAVGELTFQHQL